MQLDGLTYLIHTYKSWCLVPYKYGRLICCTTNYRNSEDNTKHTLIYLPNKLSKPCTKLLEKSCLATLIRNKKTWILFIQKNIFRLGSIAMIKFYHVKQERLLNVGPCRIYNISVDQEGCANVDTNMLGRLTKITTEQCLHLRMVAWSDVQLFFTKYQTFYL